MSAVSIRLASRADAVSIADMLSKLADELGDTDAFQTDANTINDHGFADDPRFYCQIAVSGGLHIGLSLYFPHFSTTKGQAGAYVQDLWVEPGFRSKFIGPKLLTNTARHAAEAWQAEYLKLTVYADNSGAARFYKRLGFSAQSDDRPLVLDGMGFQKIRGAQ